MNSRGRRTQARAEARRIAKEQAKKSKELAKQYRPKKTRKIKNDGGES